MTAQKKLWGGRFAKGTHPLVERFTSSIAVDQRLARFDVVGSIAHAKMLGKCRIIPASDSRRIVQGLTRILKAIEQGRWKADQHVEDVHTQIQQQLERLIGPAARRLHTARSRNDQVALDLRLYCREAVGELSAGIRAAQRALVGLARANASVVIPGYTHLQRAQPVLLAHHLLAYVEMLDRDRARLAEARVRIEVLPLGACALAGTSLPIDRAYVAKLIGFPRIAGNSMDAVSDRDFAVELVSAVAILGMHLSRLSEDIILWSTQEFGIVRLDDAFATGSSLMPQKKNPDVLELIRGQAGVLAGSLTGLLAMLKGLPMSYNRDLQWDKRCVFEAVDAALGALGVLAPLVQRLEVRRDRVGKLLNEDSLCATDLAEFLVQRGVAFPDAHRIVGALVLEAERRGTRLRELSLAEFRRASVYFDATVRTLLDPVRSVARKKSAGGTGPAEVQQALRMWSATLRKA
jgi:argininosuccinate lyase